MPGLISDRKTLNGSRVSHFLRRFLELNGKRGMYNVPDVDVSLECINWIVCPRNAGEISIRHISGILPYL